MSEVSEVEFDELSLDEEIAAISGFYGNIILVLNAAEDDEIADCDFYCRDEMIPFPIMCRLVHLGHVLKGQTTVEDMITQFSRESRKTIVVMDGLDRRFSIDPDGTVTA